MQVYTKKDVFSKKSLFSEKSYQVSSVCKMKNVRAHEIGGPAQQKKKIRKK